MAKSKSLLIRDKSLRQAVQKALRGDRAFSYADIKDILRSTLDGDGVTRQEFDDLQGILRDSKTIDMQSRNLIKNFLAKRYKPIAKRVNQPTGQLTTNFNISEFACKDGTAVPASLRANAKELAQNLQKLRDAVGKPININSAYRTPKHNKSIGGKSNSQHLYAKAADIRIRGMTPAEVKKRILELIKKKKMKQGGIGLYNTFVHYDIRGTAARW